VFWSLHIDNEDMLNILVFWFWQRHFWNYLKCNRAKRNLNFQNPVALQICDVMKHFYALFIVFFKLFFTDYHAFLCGWFDDTFFRLFFFAFITHYAWWQSYISHFYKTCILASVNGVEKYLFSSYTSICH